MLLTSQRTHSIIQYICMCIHTYCTRLQVTNIFSVICYFNIRNIFLILLLRHRSLCVHHFFMSTSMKLGFYSYGYKSYGCRRHQENTRKAYVFIFRPVKTLILPLCDYYVCTRIGLYKFGTHCTTSSSHYIPTYAQF